MLEALNGIIRFLQGATLVKQHCDVNYRRYKLDSFTVSLFVHVKKYLVKKYCYTSDLTDRSDTKYNLSPRRGLSGSAKMATMMCPENIVTVAWNHSDHDVVSIHHESTKKVTRMKMIMKTTSCLVIVHSSTARLLHQWKQPVESKVIWTSW